jgi:hypothetical protein
MAFWYITFGFLALLAVLGVFGLVHLIVEGRVCW